MTLQKEFCDNLKDRIYKEQETEQDQMEEIYKLNKQIKKQQRESEEKDLIIFELNNIIGKDRDKCSNKSLNSNGSMRSKSPSRTNHNKTAPKKSSLKKQSSRPSITESKASKAMH
jgi:hypothetical protein